LQFGESAERPMHHPAIRHGLAEVITLLATRRGDARFLDEIAEPRIGFWLCGQTWFHDVPGYPLPIAPAEHFDDAPAYVLIEAIIPLCIHQRMVFLDCPSAIGVGKGGYGRPGRIVFQDEL